jgi:hypothetical protein
MPLGVITTGGGACTTAALAAALAGRGGVVTTGNSEGMDEVGTGPAVGGAPLGSGTPLASAPLVDTGGGTGGSGFAVPTGAPCMARVAPGMLVAEALDQLFVVSGRAAEKLPFVPKPRWPGSASHVLVAGGGGGLGTGGVVEVEANAEASPFFSLGMG